MKPKIEILKQHLLLNGVVKEKEFVQNHNADEYNIYLQAMEDYAIEYSKELQHYKDTTAGLYCTDRPELFKDESGILFKIDGEKYELNLINRVDYFCASSLDPETFNKWNEVKDVLLTTRNLKH